MSASETSTVDHWRTMIDSPVIRYVDLQDREFTLQIKKVVKGKVTGAGAKTSTKAMIWFEGKDKDGKEREKPLAAGSAICGQIATLYGNSTKKWIGKWITIWPDPSVMYGKDRVGGIRVRLVVPAGVVASEQATLVSSDDVAEARKQIDAAAVAQEAK